MSEPAHTLVYTHGGGRLGNQIVRFAHWIAWAEAQGGAVAVCNFSFWPYAEYFEHWRSRPGCTAPVDSPGNDRWARRWAMLPERVRGIGAKNDRLARVLHLVARSWPRVQACALDVLAEETADMEKPVFGDYARGKALTFYAGWRIHAWNLVEARETKLRSRFQPAMSRAAETREWLAELRRRHRVLVGVHLRRGDYRLWHNGRFLFSANRYATWLREVRDLWPEAGFVLVSDEPISREVFVGLPLYEVPPGVEPGWFLDWVALTGCDCIIGPPSTYSATAAFVGEGRLWPVGDAAQAMAEEQIIEGGLAEAARHPLFSLAVK